MTPAWVVVKFRWYILNAAPGIFCSDSLKGRDGCHQHIEEPGLDFNSTMKRVPARGFLSSCIVGIAMFAMLICLAR